MDLYNTAYMERIKEYSQNAYIQAEEDDTLQRAVGIILAQWVAQASSLPLTVEGQANHVAALLKSEIKTYLCTYDKAELMIVLLGLKAFFRSHISSQGEAIPTDYEMVSRHEEILLLIQTILVSEDSAFRNRSLIDGSNNLAMALALNSYYRVVLDNIEHFTRAAGSHPDPSISIEDFLAVGAFYTEEYHRYMDELLVIGAMENPDDMMIQHPQIEQLMESQGVSKKQISAAMDVIIQQFFGFSLSNLNDFACWGLRQEPPMFLVIKEKQEYFKLLERELHGSYDAFRNIISMFSLNRLADRKERLGDVRSLELRSIYEGDASLIFYPFDLIYNVGCFEKFMLRKHFVQYFSALLPANQQAELEAQLSKHEERSSTYLAYVVLDALYAKGYKLPMKDGCPYPEVRSIVIHNRTNLLKNSGDIDVLAMDEDKKEIYNIEIKYYKPLHDLKEINSKSKADERKKNLVNPQKRKNILESYKKEVVAFLGGDANASDEYTVRTIFLTPRPDYWFFTYGGPDIEYCTWVDFHRKIQMKDI